MKKKYIIPIFVPHYGCPHECVFCNQKSITGVQKKITAQEVEQIIKEYLNTISKDIFPEVAFFGGSFTAIKKEKQEELLKVVQKFILEGKIKDIRISTRPDCITEEILEFLKQYNVATIELGVQSMDDQVLEKSLRGHTSSDVIDASKLIRKYGFKLGHQIMIGLPGDTIDKSIFTTREIIKLKPDMVRIYPVLVLNNTKLAEMYKNRKYVALDIKKSIKILKQILKLFKKNDINVIRLGLQVTENVNIGKDVIAGPFHSALRELVLSEIRLDTIIHILNNIKINSNQLLIIKVNPKEISKTIGHKKINLQKLYSLYKFKKIIVSGEKDIQEGQVVVNVQENVVCIKEDDFIQRTIN